LALATPLQLLDELSELLDLASLLAKLPPELRVFSKEFLVSLHLYRELHHISEERTSSRQAYPEMPRSAGPQPGAEDGKQIRPH